MFVRIAWNRRPLPSPQPQHLRRLSPTPRRGYDIGPIADFGKMTKGLFDRQD